MSSLWCWKLSKVVFSKGTKGRHTHFQQQGQDTGLYMPDMPHIPGQASGLVGTSPGDEVRQQRPQQLPRGGRGRPSSGRTLCRTCPSPTGAQLHWQGAHRSSPFLVCVCTVSGCVHECSLFQYSCVPAWISVPLHVCLHAYVLLGVGQRMIPGLCH